LDNHATWPQPCFNFGIFFEKCKKLFSRFRKRMPQKPEKFQQFYVANGLKNDQRILLSNPLVVF